MVGVMRRGNIREGGLYEREREEMGERIRDVRGDIMYFWLAFVECAEEYEEDEEEEEDDDEDEFEADREAEEADEIFAEFGAETGVLVVDEGIGDRKRRWGVE